MTMKQLLVSCAPLLLGFRPLRQRDGRGRELALALAKRGLAILIAAVVVRHVLMKRWWETKE